MKTSVKYLTAFGVGVVLAGVVANYRGVFSADSVSQVMLALSDGCVVPAMVYLGFGLLMMISSTGMFDITRYGMGQLFSLFRKDYVRKDKDFYAYVQRKREERKQRGRLAYLLITGIVFLILAALFTGLFFYFE